MVCFLGLFHASSHNILVISFAKMPPESVDTPYKLENPTNVGNIDQIYQIFVLFLM